MKKNWNNPAIKSLNVEYTHEEEYDGWVLGDDGSKVDAKSIDRSANPACFGKFGYKCRIYLCYSSWSCNGINGALAFSSSKWV